LLLAIKPLIKKNTTAATAVTLPVAINIIPSRFSLHPVWPEVLETIKAAIIFNCLKPIELVMPG
jgi:hypothetical protein